MNAKKCKRLRKLLNHYDAEDMPMEEVVKIKKVVHEGVTSEVKKITLRYPKGSKRRIYQDGKKEF